MRERLGAEHFEALYARDGDPWDFATSDYEAGKYAATIAALDGRRYARGLEVGCSIGVLTAQLVGHCDALLAVDVSEAALAQGRARVPEATFERREIPEQWPPGGFDLIVCSEVLYYLDPPAFAQALAAIERGLEPGGSLLAVHWRHPTRTYPLRGDEVHARLAALGWPAGARERTADYVLERFDRP